MNAFPDVDQVVILTTKTGARVAFHRNQKFRLIALKRGSLTRVETWHGGFVGLAREPEAILALIRKAGR